MGSLPSGRLNPLVRISSANTAVSVSGFQESSVTLPAVASYPANSLSRLISVRVFSLIRPPSRSCREKVTSASLFPAAAEMTSSRIPWSSQLAFTGIRNSAASGQSLYSTAFTSSTVAASAVAMPNTASTAQTITIFHENLRFVFPSAISRSTWASLLSAKPAGGTGLCSRSVFSISSFSMNRSLLCHLFLQDAQGMPDA